MFPGFRFPEFSSVRSSTPGVRIEGNITNPNFIRAQFQVFDQRQILQALDAGYLVLHKEKLGQFLEMRDILYMLDLVETQI